MLRHPQTWRDPGIARGGDLRPLRMLSLPILVPLLHSTPGQEVLMHMGKRPFRAEVIHTLGMKLQFRSF